MAKDGLHVVVRNTFLEFSDDTPHMGEDDVEPRRVRAFSDLTDSKLPVKVELSNAAGFYHMSRHRISSTLDHPGPAGSGGAGSAGAPGGGDKSPTGLGLPTVMEEPDAFGGGFTSGLSGMLADGGRMPPMGIPGMEGWMPPGGMVPGYGGMPPMWGWPGQGYGLPTPGLPPPPFPPGMMNYGYGGQPGGHNPYAMGQAQTPDQYGGGQQRNQRGPKNQKNNLQLSEHLGETGGRASKPKGGQGGGGGGGGSPQSGPSAAAAGAEAVRNMNPADLSTVMLRNVPNSYTRDMLLTLLDARGFACRYDFVYLPMDFRNGVNLGYAFVNLLTHEDAESLTEKLQGFSEWVSDSTKVCEVSWAHPHQGLREHVERYRNSPVMHPSMPEEYKPMVFRNGGQQPFPHPTKAIKAPKLRLTTRDGKPSQEDSRGIGGDLVAVCA